MLCRDTVYQNHYIVNCDRYEILCLLNEQQPRQFLHKTKWFYLLNTSMLNEAR